MEAGSSPSEGAPAGCAARERVGLQRLAKPAVSPHTASLTHRSPTSTWQKYESREKCLQNAAAHQVTGTACKPLPSQARNPGGLSPACFRYTSVRSRG